MSLWGGPVGRTFLSAAGTGWKACPTTLPLHGVPWYACTRPAPQLAEENHLSKIEDPPKDWPAHVAIIMDGNGRWARQRRLPRLEGHRRGAKAVRGAVEFCRKNGIQVLTLYAFSSENWQRPEKEVSGLMRLLSATSDSEADDILGNNISFRTIGRVERLPAQLAAKIEALRERSKNNRTMVLNLALSYGGREKLLAAALKLAKDLKDGALKEHDVTEEGFSRLLETADLPDPDLLIRTGGELRSVISFCGRWHTLSYILPRYYGLISATLHSWRPSSLTGRGRDASERPPNRSRARRSRQG